MAKHGLGRGLDALLGDLSDTASVPADAVVQLRLSDIDPNRDQPRTAFDEQSLRELADSIRSVGVIQPIIVRKLGARYQIISGERRWRAARLAEQAEIPAIVRDWDETRRLEVALIENLQRDDLNPVDEAIGVRALMDQCGYTQEAAAERLGKSRSALANLLRILSLPEPVLALLRDGKLSEGHARALASLDDPEHQIRLANLCAAQGWSVRQLERTCQEAKSNPAKPERAPRPPEFRQLERMAREAFGTKAKLEGDAAHGKLTLHYYSAEDLQRIWDVLEDMKK